jgi:hypothetical protein
MTVKVSKESETPDYLERTHTYTAAKRRKKKKNNGCKSRRKLTYIESVQLITVSSKSIVVEFDKPIDNFLKIWLCSCHDDVSSDTERESESERESVWFKKE